MGASQRQPEGNASGQEPSQNGMSKTKLTLLVLGVSLGIAVVGMVILAVIAVPKFQKFSLKTKQVEAQAGLSSLYTSQKIYHIDAGKYTTDIESLGFLVGQQRYYKFSCSASQDEFTCQARGNLDQDPAMDVWTIDQNQKMVQVKDDSED